MDAITLIRTQVQGAQQFLEVTLGEPTAEQLHFNPDGKAMSVGAVYAHALISEDTIVNAALQGSAPLLFAQFGGQIGLSTLPPLPEAENPFKDWESWSRTVTIDLPALRAYGEAVHTATNAYLANLTNEQANAERPAAPGMGSIIVTLSFLVNHTSWHTGEISAVKGLQGLKGYPI